MNSQINQLTLETGVEAVQKQWSDAKPKCGLMLGSGWGTVTEDFQALENPACRAMPRAASATT
ncbi:MAG: hypothetical protein K9M45_10320 [Kiritimatiellales bacterium]|nr:hypothetical protein [Kiritimatiellales bacterium]